MEPELEQMENLFFAKLKKKYNTILAYFGIMIIVIIGNSNNDNDNGRFYARDVKVV